jgi:hypothetical protein
MTPGRKADLLGSAALVVGLFPLGLAVGFFVVAHRLYKRATVLYTASETDIEQALERLRGRA